MEIVIQYFVNSLNMHENVAEGKIEIEDIPEADDWVECIDKTAYQTCNNNRIQLKKSDTNQHTGFIESNDTTALSCIGWAIEKHLDDIPSELRPTFQKILEDTRIKKENLERS